MSRARDRARAACRATRRRASRAAAPRYSGGLAGLAKCKTPSTRPATGSSSETSARTNVNAELLARWATFCGRPVHRLSTATTSSPRPRNASQRCEPTNPEPPVMTIREIYRRPTAVVCEAASPHRGRVEEVAGVDDRAAAHRFARRGRSRASGTRPTRSARRRRRRRARRRRRRPANRVRAATWPPAPPPPGRRRARSRLRRAAGGRHERRASRADRRCRP